MLSFQEMVDLRRHLGVPVAGVAESGTILRVGRLEYLMRHLQAEEEAVITGRPFSIIQILGNVLAGQTITVGITPTGGVETQTTYTVVASDTTVNDPRLNVALNLGLKITGLNIGVVAACGAIPAGNANIPPGCLLPSTSQCTLTSSTITWRVTTLSATGGLAVYLLKDGTYPHPSMTYTDPVSGAIVTIYGMVPICNMLEDMIYNSTEDLDLDHAGASGPQGGAKLRHDELNQREILYQRACRRLSKMFGAWGN